MLSKYIIQFITIPSQFYLATNKKDFKIQFWYVHNKSTDWHAKLVWWCAQSCRVASPIKKGVLSSYKLFFLSFFMASDNKSKNNFYAKALLYKMIDFPKN